MTKKSQSRTSNPNGFSFFGYSTVVLLFQAGLIVTACFWIFWPAVHGDWIWDDEVYVMDNPLLRDPQRLWKAWFQPGSFIEYYPIEQTVRWLQWKVFQEDVFGYHLTSILLHAANSLLVWRLFNRLDLRFAWLAGLLFAVHPLQVESVAWIAELKNTLSMLPLLLAMTAWIDYENHRRRSDYLQALGFFLAAMLCKVSMAPLPVFFLVFAWWKRGRVGWTDLKQSLPFFLVSLALGLLVIWTGQVYSERQFFQPLEVPLDTWTERLSCVGQALIFYFAKLVFPLNPSPLYPQWPVDGRSLYQFLPWVIFGAAFARFWVKRETWGKHALLGSVFFILFLLPFVGFIPVSYMRFTWVMDHFVYIPILGGIGLFVAALGRLNELFSPAGRRWGAGLLFVALFGLVTISRGYASKYKGLDPLFSYALELLPDSGMAYHNLGVARNRQHRVSEAILQFQVAARLMPRDLNSRLNLGHAFWNEGRNDEALLKYEEALEIWPGSINAQLSLGDLLLSLNRNDEALAHYQKYLKLNPGSGPLQVGVGNALFQSGRYAEAVEPYQAALTTNFYSALVRHNLGRTYRQLGRLQEAMQQYRLALGIDPDYVDAHINFGVVLYMVGNTAGAIHEYEEALRLDPANAQARANLSGLRGY